MQATLISATRNADKLREIRQAVEGIYTVLPCPEGIPEVDETADTYEGNARLKAEAVSGYVKGVVVAEDSGIEVDALAGAPGVYSARFSGLDANSQRNREKLLAAMADVPEEKRQARYRTVAVLRFPDGREIVAEGVCEGAIATTLRGEGGFGYDPIFIPSAGDGRTFAEMSQEEKNALSHRAKAFKKLVAIVTAHAQEAR